MFDTMITVFNQLTDNKLADCKIFKGIISNNFMKFRFFYYVLKRINVDMIENIVCDASDDGDLTFFIKCKNLDSVSIVRDYINDGMDEFSHMFTLDIDVLDDKFIEIHIEGLTDNSIYKGDTI